MKHHNNLMLNNGKAEHNIALEHLEHLEHLNLMTLYEALGI